MIITSQKPLDEILGFISPYKSVLIAGCDGCTQPPRGLREAKTLAQLLALGAESRGKKVELRVITLAKQCDSYLTVTSLEPQIGNAEAIVSLACGLGVQTIAQVLPDLPVFPAQNTLFIGTEIREDSTIEERCAACGDCILALTGGICPIARCAKSLLNGPCGGSQNGKCEIDPEKDCAWDLIIKRLDKLGRLSALDEIRPPRDFGQVVRPGRIAG
ncbi:MAG: methylenetetrahydrofolate reductase C-terminal domain-containing protein [Dehalococcoidia bacterium]